MKTVNSSVKFFGLNKLLRFIKPNASLLIVMVIAEFINGALVSTLPLFQRYALDNYIANTLLDGLWIFAVVYLAVELCIFVANYISAFSCCKLEMYLLRDMRRELFNHLQTLSVSYFNVTPVGKIHARIMSDTSGISSCLSWDIRQGVWFITNTVVGVTVMFILNAYLALIVLAIIPVMAVIAVFFNRKLIKLNRKVRETNSEIVANINEGVVGAPTTKSLAAEQKLESNFEEHTLKMKRHSLRACHYRAVFISIISLLSSSTLALILWYGGVISAEGAIGIGTLGAFLSYAQNLTSIIAWGVEVIADFIGVRVNTERVAALLEQESDVADTPEVIEKYGDSFVQKRENWEKLEGEIEFDDVTFKYPDGEEYVLEHFNMKVPKGTTVALVGETGAGKSTLVNLVCRFFEPVSGRILIDGIDARERSVGWLHANMGYVLQSPHLFSGTVRENLLYGKEDATDEEMWEALKLVSADKIVEKMDGGLDAQVGEGGNTLSVGEKQMISFARAVLADPAIFIFDEATSSVDSLTEKIIQDAADKLIQGRTSFVIAHRLSTVVSADIILVIDDGKIVERGTHNELLKKRGAYFALYERQRQGIFDE